MLHDYTYLYVKLVQSRSVIHILHVFSFYNIENDRSTRYTNMYEIKESKRDGYDWSMNKE